MRWQMPVARFAKHAVRIGHVHCDPQDAVTRSIVLERVLERQQKWALALEAWRVATGNRDIVSSPTDVSAGDRLIRSRWDDGRPMRVHFRASNEIPRVSMIALIKDGNVKRTPTCVIVKEDQKRRRFSGGPQIVDALNALK